MGIIACILAGSPYDDVVAAFAIALVILLIYFLPTIIAWKKRNGRAIFMLNFLLGWTLVGWIIALIWAFTIDPPEPIIVQQAPQIAANPMLCSICGKYSAPGAGFCISCGQSFTAPILPPYFQCVSCGKPALAGSKLCGACGGFARTVTEA